MSEEANLQLYSEGDDLYAAMLSAIAGARHSILFETYIFADDEIGQQFAAALIAALGRGVVVRLHIDAAGSLFWHSHRMARQLKDAGVQLRWFHRWSWRQPWRYNRRNHRKILVIDRQRVFLGGFNIHRENSRAVYGERRWHDFHISVSGHFGEQAAQLFDAFWEHRRRVWAPPLPSGDMLISNHGHAGRQAMRRLYRQGFADAEESIDLITPYFVPDHVTRKALLEAARRGVSVRLLLPRKTDVIIARWAAHASYARLLEAGVQIYEYLPRVLHAKLAVIDGRWAVIGTANLDYRSFFVNYELNLVTSDEQLCRKLQQEFEHDLAQSAGVYRRYWVKRPWLHRLAESTAWLVRRWL
jgi:cardiolipin synthase